MKKVIPLTLVNLSVFDPITEEPDITDNIIITNMLESIGNFELYCSIICKQGILIPEVSTLHIRISGDGRNVVLYPGAETYESLKNVLVPLISDLCNLKKNGFNQIGGNHWPVELYFSSDWKFLAICLGIKAANG
ncbi:hypothetical protein RhiirA4_467936 [Rhizophagus irregularis]|uniref:Uncharacterized protein n=1 Tax=Rhizophagus irregularis TaxID=588596 RepID=A0A2I1GWT1_9GLOM|nr:hypothetical protein RhiirA4_467936 [Rhizophagus irregularis]